MRWCLFLAACGSQNLVVNGDFDDGTAGWTVENADAEVVDGALRVTSTVGGPGLAWQEVPVDPGRYVLTGTIVGGTYLDSAHIRVGVAPNDGDGLYVDDLELEVVAEGSSLFVTCNNVGVDGDFGVFDDVALVPAD